jgi:NADH-quinone oxidoreductase subunit N
MPAEVRFELLWPEFLVAGLAFVIFTLDFFLRPERKNILAWVSVIGLAGILAFTIPHLMNENDSLFNGLYRVDDYALFFKVLSMAIGGAVILGSIHFVGRYLTHPGEYYAIILLSVLAMMMMAASGELLTAYLSLELLSFCLYILSGFALHDSKSNEASVKYILLGAFSSGLLLYGIVMMYGALGTTSFAEMALALEGIEDIDGRLLIGLTLLISGLGFKMAAVPFHMWAPDVYEGAPMPITAYIAVGSKVAAFALVLRLFAEGLLPAIDQWNVLIAGLAALTMLFGNLVALAQTNMKRMLAYSSVGQVGFLLMGIAALSTLSSNGLMVHLVGYSATNLVVFFAITAFYNVTGKEDIVDFAGLAGRSPFLAAAITVSLFSLAGLPFLAGFVTKFYLFSAAAAEDLLWLAGVAMVASLISLYYYLNVVRQMYISPAADGEEGAIKVPNLLYGLVGVLVIIVILLGVYPEPLVNIIENATDVILPAAGAAALNLP